MIVLPLPVESANVFRQSGGVVSNQLASSQHPLVNDIELVLFRCQSHQRVIFDHHSSFQQRRVRNEPN